jgi:hypothetical protein
VDGLYTTCYLTSLPILTVQAYLGFRSSVRKLDVLLAHPSRFSLSDHLHLPSRAASTINVLLIRSCLRRQLSLSLLAITIPRSLHSSTLPITASTEAFYNHQGLHQHQPYHSTGVIHVFPYQSFLHRVSKLSRRTSMRFWLTSAINCHLQMVTSS